MRRSLTVLSQLGYVRRSFVETVVSDPGYTATHYVAPFASVSGATSDEDVVNGTAYASATAIGTPCTLAEALANATAGDVIECAAGVYTGSTTNHRWNPAWAFTNSGTSVNPIIIYAVNPAATNVSNRSELRNGHTTNDNGGCPTFGANIDDYVIWDGFYVNENVSYTHTDTGPVVLFSGTGVRLRRLVIQGDPDLRPFDNHTSIRIEQCDDFEVSDCECYDNYSGSNQYNGSTIETYSARNGVIQNNYLHDSHGGIFIKGSIAGQVSNDVIIRRNHVYNVSIGIALAAIAADSPSGVDGTYGAYVYQNIIDTTGDGIIFRGYLAGEPRDGVVTNNLVINASNTLDAARAIYLKAGDYSADVFRNNLVVNVEYSISASEESSTAGIDIDENMYHNFTDNFGSYSGGSSSTLADWVLNTPWDDNSVDDDPEFENELGGDYRLAAGSPALDAGTDYLNLLGGGTSAAINYGPYILSDQSDEIGIRTSPDYS